MPRAVAHDGVELHWEERGSGPPVLLVPYWSFEPRVWEPITAELEGEFRLVRYDDRGTGESDRVGPYDLETTTGDLEAVAEAAGLERAVAIGMTDGTNRAVRVAHRRPDLISHVLTMGGPPLRRDAFSSSDSLVSSNVVVDAFMQQLDTDYRAAVRALMEAGNSQMTQEDLRDRVAKQIEYVPGEVASVRIREWAEDSDTAELARELGDRLVALIGGNAGGWFPDDAEMVRLIEEHFPEAVIEMVDDGIISRPDQTAAVVRRIHSAVGAADVDSVA